MTFLVGYENFLSRNHQGTNELPMGMLKKTSSKAAARSTARSIMSATFVGAGETVSRPCLKAPQIWHEAITPLEGFFSILPQPRQRCL